MDLVEARSTAALHHLGQGWLAAVAAQNRRFCPPTPGLGVHRASTADGLSHDLTAAVTSIGKEGCCREPCRLALRKEPRRRLCDVPYRAPMRESLPGRTLRDGRPEQGSPRCREASCPTWRMVFTSPVSRASRRRCDVSASRGFPDAGAKRHLRLRHPPKRRRTAASILMWRARGLLYMPGPPAVSDSSGRFPGIRLRDGIDHCLMAPVRRIRLPRDVPGGTAKPVNGPVTGTGLTLDRLAGRARRGPRPGRCVASC